MSYSKLSIRTRRRSVFIALFVVLVVTATIPMPQSITCPCLIEPSAVWFLARDGAGQIISGWDQNLLGPTGSQTLLQFDRPDVVDFQFSSKLIEGNTVQAGDTIAVLYSGESERKLIDLETELTVVRAEKNALLAGDSPEDREVARREALFAETAVNEFQPAYDRIKSLFESGNTSLAEWQSIQAQWQKLLIEKEVAQTRFISSQAGARPEDIDVAQSEVTRLERLVENSRNSLHRMTSIVAPIDGTIHLSDGNGKILRIDQIDTMAAVIPLPEAVAGKITPNQPAGIRLFTNPYNIINSTINRIDYRDNRDFSSSAVVLLENADGGLKTGMNGVVELPLGHVTIWEGIWMKLKGARY